LWFLSVWLSRQSRHSLSAVAAVAVVTAAVVVVAGFMEAEAVVSMVVADMAADIAVVEDIVAAGMAAHGLMVAGEVATQAAGLKLAAIPVRPQIGRRQAFLAQSTMASGIRSATPVVRLVPRV